jgi:hypothetical protein
MVDDLTGFAVGLELTLVPTSEGGRRSAVISGPGKSYRPNWGLPTMVPPDQTGAPVFAMSPAQLSPGERARAVILPPFPEIIPRWRREVVPDVVLPMYEGMRVVGHGRVLWVAETDLVVSAPDEARVIRWLAGGEDHVHGWARSGCGDRPT